MTGNMKRKVVRHGPSTMTVSLPTSFVVKNNIKAGSTIDMEEKGSSLIINTQKEDKPMSIEIDVKDNNKIGVRYITSLYRKGYDEITLVYEDPNYINRIERCISEDILGFEIITQTKRSCTIKDVAGVKLEEYDAVLRRTWLILLSMAEDVTNAFEKKDKSIANNIIIVDKRINKFTNFCIRVLNKRGHQKYHNIPVYYRFLRSMEELADDYKFLIKYYSEGNLEVSKDFLVLMKSINSYLKLFYESFYKPSDKSLEYLLVETQKTNDRINLYYKKKNEQLLTAILFEINDKLRSLISSIIEMNVEG